MAHKYDGWWRQLHMHVHHYFRVRVWRGTVQMRSLCGRHSIAVIGQANADTTEPKCPTCRKRKGASDG